MNRCDGCGMPHDGTLESATKIGWFVTPPELSYGGGPWLFCEDCTKLLRKALRESQNTWIGRAIHAEDMIRDHYAILRDREAMREDEKKRMQT